MAGGIEMHAALAHGAFLSIPIPLPAGGSVTCFGGDQAWYGTRVGRLSGCGAVAAADVFAYLARRDRALSALFQGDANALTKESFLAHMSDVIAFVRPTSLHRMDIPYGGLTSIPRFVRYCEAFAQSRGVPLKAVAHDNRGIGYDGVVEVVAAQLRQDNPIAMLNMRNRSLQRVPHRDALGNPIESDLQYHWVVLTAIEKRDGRWVATASSEGCRVEFDFENAWGCDAKTLFGWRGIVYFT